MPISPLFGFFAVPPQEAAADLLPYQSLIFDPATDLADGEFLSASDKIIPAAGQSPVLKRDDAASTAASLTPATGWLMADYLATGSQPFIFNQRTGVNCEIQADLHFTLTSTSQFVSFHFRRSAEGVVSPSASGSLRMGAAYPDHDIEIRVRPTEIGIYAYPASTSADLLQTYSVSLQQTISFRARVTNLANGDIRLEAWRDGQQEVDYQWTPTSVEYLRRGYVGIRFHHGTQGVDQFARNIEIRSVTPALPVAWERPETGLEMEYLLDSTTPVDTSGNGLTPVVTGTLDDTSSSQRFGRGAWVDGSSYVDTGLLFDHENSDWTVAAWIQIPSITTDIFFGARYGGQTYDRADLLKQGTGWQIYAYGGGSDDIIIPSTVPEADGDTYGTWVFVVASGEHTGRTKKLYVFNEMDEALTSLGPTTEPIDDNFYMFAQNYNGVASNICQNNVGMHSVRFWSRQLSDYEVMKLMRERITTWGTSGWSVDFQDQMVRPDDASLGAKWVEDASHLDATFADNAIDLASGSMRIYPQDAGDVQVPLAYTQLYAEFDVQFATGAGVLGFWWDLATAQGASVNRLDIDPAGSLTATNGTNSGTGSVTVAVDTWYRVRLLVDRTGATPWVKAWLDGELVIDQSISLSAAGQYLAFDCQTAPVKLRDVRIGSTTA